MDVFRPEAAAGGWGGFSGSRASPIRPSAELKTRHPPAIRLRHRAEGARPINLTSNFLAQCREPHNAVRLGLKRRDIRPREFRTSGFFKRRVGPMRSW